MKKFLALFLCLFTVQAAMWADNDPIRVNQLPQQAQTFISTHFGNDKVAIVEEDDSWLSTSYEVLFTNGDKVEFNGDGAWTEVCSKDGEVPAQIIPQLINKHVDSHYPDADIRRIEKDGDNYEIILSNGWELEFDKAFKVIDVDTNK